ncbi:MAG: hypothetical protein ACLRHW_12060 [Coprobacillus cateniformis]
MNFTRLDLYELKMILKLALVYNLADNEYIKRINWQNRVYGRSIRYK